MLGRSATMNTRGEQIVARLFLKVALLVSDARTTAIGLPTAAGRADKWFQLDVRDDGRFNALAQEVRDMAPGDGVLELRVRVVLVLPPLAPPAAQALVLLPEPTATSATRRVRVELPHDARAILLEEWTLALDRTQAQRPPHSDDPYPGVYKQAIALVRSLYALLRYVPAWRLHRGLGAGAPMHIAVGAALAPDALDEDVLGFAHRLVPDDPGPSTFAFPPIATPLGAIVLRTQYRPHTRFRLDPLENLWSSAFASPSATPPTATPANPTSPLSGGNPNTVVGRTPSSTSPARVVDLDSPAFTPTLLATRQRASLSGSGSPLRHTPTSNSNVPSNIALPSNPNVTVNSAPFSPIRPRTVSQLSTGPIPRSPPASPRLGLATDFTSAGGGTGGGASGLTRTRRESLLTGARSGNGTADAGPSGVGADSPRRTPINPFKSATLASSPRTLALGAGVGGSPLGMAGSPRTTPGLGIGTPPRTGAGVGAGMGLGLGGSPSGRRSIDSTAGEPGPSNLSGGGGLSVQPQPIKRYSSSFGHRPGRSEGSLGSGGVGSLGVGGGVVGSAGTGTGTGGSAGAGGAGSAGTGSVGTGGVEAGTSAGSGNPAVAGHGRRLTTIGSQSYISHIADDEEISRFLNEIDSRPQLGHLGLSGEASTSSADAGSGDADTSVSGSTRSPLGLEGGPRSPLGLEGNARSPLGLDAGPRSPLGLDTGTRSPLGLDTTPVRPLVSPVRERFPLSSPMRERFPLSSPVQERFGLPAERFPSSGGERFPTSGQERLPTPNQDRFPASSLPTRYATLPPLSPLGQTSMGAGIEDAPRPLPPPLESVPPSPAESAWALRRATSRERRTASGERGVRGTSGERGVRGMSRERTGRGLFGESVLAPLPERGYADRNRDRTMTPSMRDRTVSLAGSPSLRDRALLPGNMSPATRERTLSLAERERTISFARRNRTLLTSRDDVEAAVQLMTASFQASFAPPSPVPASPAIESGRRQIGSEEIVGRLELGGSGSAGAFGGTGTRGGSVREGRDTDGWREGGEWDQRMGGWR